MAEPGLPGLLLICLRLYMDFRQHVPLGTARSPGLGKVVGRRS
jgi:hypothetical protein